MSLESYEILGVHPNSELSEIRQAFRHLALQTHPDHGGNPRLFMIVKRAYKDILNTMDAKTRHQFHNMKKEFKESEQYHAERRSAPIIDPNNFNQAKFNEVFEQHRLHTANDNGYDLSKEITVSAEQYETQVTQYSEPEFVNSRGGYQELGQKHIDDYTAPFNAKIQYTDAQRAYAIPTEEAKLKTRKDYTSLKDLNKERKSMKMVATAEEQAEFERVQAEKMNLEKIRQKNYRKQLKRGQEIGDRMTQFIGL